MPSSELEMLQRYLIEYNLTVIEPETKKKIDLSLLSPTVIRTVAEGAKFVAKSVAEGHPNAESIHATWHVVSQNSPYWFPKGE